MKQQEKKRLLENSTAKQKEAQMKKDAEEALLKAKQAEEKMKAMQVGLCEIYLTICPS